MPASRSVGAEVAEVPVGELIRNLAQGIAEGQRALDAASVQSLVQLANTKVSIIPEITEVIAPSPQTIPVSGQPDVIVTGVRVTATPAAPVVMSALQAGILPTFYQFTEATVTVKVSLSVRETEEVDSDGKRQTGVRVFASNVNFKTQNTYSYQADASSSIVALMRPVPPPSRVVPATITVNTIGPTPTVTHA